MSLNPGSRGVLGRIVLVCGAITAGAGALILVGWAIGWDALTTVGAGYVPMAPNTALLFVLLGSAVLIREAWPASRVIHRIATAAAVFSAVMGSVTLIGFAIGLNIDDWLFSTMRMLGEVPMGHMSPVTAFCFVLAGGSLLLLECQARTWAAISGTLITLAGAVYLMGYGFGAPLLYGGTVIPVALPTSLALVALGIGLTAAAGPDTWPLNTLIGPSTRARLLRALLPTVVLLALINSWITAVLLEHSDPGVVLASAMTAVSFLLVVGFVVSWVSRAIGDAIDRTEAERKRAEEALRQVNDVLRNEVSERSRTEMAYRESEQQMRLFMEATADCLWNWDLIAGNVVRSISFNRAFGYSAQEMDSSITWWEERLHPADRGKVISTFQDTVASGGNACSYEYRFRCKDGTHAVINDHAYIVRDAKGKPLRALGAMTDITERKRVDAALRARETQLSLIHDNVHEVIFVISVEPNDHFRFITVNHKFVEVTGFPEDQIVGKLVQEVIPEPAHALVFGKYKEAIRNRQSAHWEEVSVYPAGKRIGEVTVAPVFDENGNCTQLIGTVYDITERKRTEDALRNSSKRLRKLSQRLIEVEDGVRRKINRELHDRVGANLSAINLNLSILGSQLPQTSLRAVGTRLQDTQRLLEETTAHVRDLMADLHPPALDDYGLLAALRTYVASLGVRFAVPISAHGEDLAPRLPLAVETALFRVAHGALVNAVMHAHAKRIEVLLAASPDGVELTIADDGIGFDVAHTSMAHASWGLAIMRERAEAVGAELTVESTPGKGTRVRVEISREKR